jgi:hypothetical protein
VLFGVLLVLAAIAAVAPYGAVWIAGLGMTVARVIDRTNTALLMRRDLHGPRGSDGLVTTMALPWRIVTSAVATVLALILPILIGISVAFIAAWVAAGDPVNQKPGDPGALALGMVALVLTAWWGPGGGSVRRGSGKAVKSLVRGRRAQIVLWAVLGLVVVSALIVMSGPNEPDWGPLNGYRIIDMLTFP